MKKTLKRVAALALAGVMTFSLAACGGGKSSGEAKNTEPIKVGARDWVEQYILMEVMAYALEQNGYKCERVPDIGGTDLIQEALVKGDIDIASNYSSSFYNGVLGYDPSYDKDEVYNVSKKDMKDKYNLILLEQSDIDNSYGLFMRKDRAKELGITKVSDLTKKAKDLVFANHGGWLDFAKERLGEVYGEGITKWKEVKLFDMSLRYSSVLNGEADVSTAYTTDGELADENIILLEEDGKNVYEPYFVIPVVKGELLEKYPEVETIINDVFKKLTQTEMVKLNAKASIDKEDYDKVAQEWYDNNFK